MSLGGGYEGGLPGQARQQEGRQSWGGRHQLPSRGPIIAAIFLELGATRRREITTIMELMLLQEFQRENEPLEASGTLLLLAANFNLIKSQRRHSPTKHFCHYSNLLQTLSYPKSKLVILPTKFPKSENCLKCQEKPRIWEVTLLTPNCSVSTCYCSKWLYF